MDERVIKCYDHEKVKSATRYITVDGGLENATHNYKIQTVGAMSVDAPIIPNLRRSTVSYYTILLLKLLYLTIVRGIFHRTAPRRECERECSKSDAVESKWTTKPELCAHQSSQLKTPLAIRST